MSNTLSIDLLAPRYEVIADYPGSFVRVGNVIEWNSTLESYVGEDSFGVKIYFDNHIENYPHVFRKLQWYEKRTVEEMPKYVKWDFMPNVDDKKMEGHVQKVTGWSQAYFGVATEGGSVTASKNWLPATEQAYTEYLKSKP